VGLQIYIVLLIDVEFALNVLLASVRSWLLLLSVCTTDACSSCYNCSRGAG